MSNSKSRHLAGCIVLSLILVSLAGIQPMLKVADTAEDYRLDKDTLHCAVALASILATLPLLPLRLCRATAAFLIWIP